LEDLGTDERVILEWIWGKYGWKLWSGFIQLRRGTNGRLMNTVITFGFHTRQGFFDQLSDHKLLNKDSAPWSWVIFVIHFFHTQIYCWQSYKSYYLEPQFILLNIQNIEECLR
jgi:hypothetical protein